MLKDINFRRSMRSEPIMENFLFLNNKAKKEAVRVAGPGILEGLVLSIVGPDMIEVSKGSYIGRDGEEYKVNRQTIKVQNIEPVKRTIRRMRVDSQGRLTLPYRPYSSEHKGYFNTSRYNLAYPTGDLIIRDSNYTSQTIRAVAVSNNIVTVSAAQWSGKPVDIEYLYGRDRMDTVMIHPTEGVVIREGIITPSVGHADYELYKDYIILGLIEVSLDETHKLIIHQDGRTYRNVFTDTDGILYLNGKPYRGIFFEIPDDPLPNDIYIDMDNSKIYVYSKTDDGYSWVLVSGDDITPKKEVKIFKPEECPADLQTFMFDEEETNLFFFPEGNQLEIVIDNSVLMSDQYEEIYISTEEDKNTGRGFRLNEPLERATHVEVRVLHAAQDGIFKKVYQRTAKFSKEAIYYKEYTDNNVYVTPDSYTIGEPQIAVYKNGVKLVEGTEFYPVDADEEVLIEGEVADTIKVSTGLVEGDTIFISVDKNVYSYDHIVDALEGTIGSISEALEKIENTKATVDAKILIFEDTLESVKNELNTLKAAVSKIDDYRKKDVLIKSEDIEEDVTDKLVNQKFEYIQPVSAIIDFEGIKEKDFYNAYVIGKDSSRILIKDADYTAIESEDGVSFAMDDSLIKDGNSIMVKGFKVGSDV